MKDKRPPLCMMCGREPDESQAECHRDHEGRDWWVLWSYCRPCDCWTEHRPEGMPEYL